MADDQDEKKQLIAPPNVLAQPQPTTSPIASPYSQFAANMGAPVPPPIAAPNATMPSPAAPVAARATQATIAPPTIQSGGERLWNAAKGIQNPALRIPAMIGSGIARAGDIALESLAPRIASLTPGSEINTSLRNKANEEKFEKRQAEDVAQERADTERQATEQKPEIAELQGELRGQAQGQRDADTAARQQASIEALDKREQQREAASEKARQQSESAAADRQAKQFEQQDKTESSREKSADDRQAKALEAQEQRLEKTLSEKGSELTSTTRTMVEAAPRVLDFVQRIRPLIQQEQQELGPTAGRWSEFMAGKVGAPNPNFTRLRTDVGLLQTLLMRMHVGSRGGEYIMKHFQDLIDTGKQSPENLNAALDEIERYANDVENEGKQVAPNTGQKAPSGFSGGGTTPMFRNGRLYNIPNDKVKDFEKAGGSLKQ